MENIVETINLTKRYGEKFALDKVSVHIPKGEIYGLVGRNGAGKTTLMKIICGLANPSAGEFKLFGQRGDKPGMIAQRRGMLIEDPGYFSEFDAEMNLRIKCRLLGITDREEPKRLLELVGLKDVGKKKVGNFSLGMKQRLGIAMALTGNPDIVVLDEPINGLDPQGIVDIREMIVRLRKEQGTTFIISSHILDELSKFATRYGIINQGRLVMECSAEELAEKCESKIELVTDSPAGASAVLERMGFAEIKVLEDGRINIFDSPERIGEITLAMAGAGITVYELTRQVGSVENYYLNLVGGGN